MPVKGREQGPAVFQSAQAVQPHGVEPLEDVAVIAVLRQAAVFLKEAFDILKPRDYALLARGVGGLLLLGGSKIRQFAGQFVMVNCHRNGPPAGNACKQPHLRQGAFPTHRQRRSTAAAPAPV